MLRKLHDTDSAAVVVSNIAAGICGTSSAADMMRCHCMGPAKALLFEKICCGTATQVPVLHVRTARGHCYGPKVTFQHLLSTHMLCIVRYIQSMPGLLKACLVCDSLCDSFGEASTLNLPHGAWAITKHISCSASGVGGCSTACICSADVCV
jgi:hypothetical protein